jgi:hypothetical protein
VYTWEQVCRPLPEAQTTNPITYNRQCLPQTPSQKTGTGNHYLPPNHSLFTIKPHTARTLSLDWTCLNMVEVLHEEFESLLHTSHWNALWYSPHWTIWPSEVTLLHQCPNP